MEGTIGEIRLFAASFAPRNWSYCNGQLVSIATNTALYSILGTTYGGDGRVTFGLPQLGGRTAIGTGLAAGSNNNITLGEMAGTSQVTLLQSNLAPHLHIINASVAIPAYADTGDVPTPGNNVVLAGKTGAYSPTDNDTLLTPFQSSVQVTPTGGATPVNIVQPSMGMSYIVCMYGVFPQRS